MWFARYFPGVPPSELNALTPEATAALVRVGKQILKRDREEHAAHTRVIAQAAGLRVL